MTTSSEDYENFKKNMEKRILNQVSDMAVYSDDADNIKKRLMQWKVPFFHKRKQKNSPSFLILLDMRATSSSVISSDSSSLMLFTDECGLLEHFTKLART